MALVWLEGFENYANTLAANIDYSLLTKYPLTFGTWTLGSPRTANTLFSGAGAGPRIRTPIFDTHTVWIIGIGIYNNGSDTNILDVYLDETIQGSISFNSTTKQLQFTFGSVSNLLTGNSIPLNQWVYLEVKLNLASGATGSYEIKINGESVASQSGVDITNSSSTGANNFLIYCPGRIDDIYICDNTGSTNNDFLGDIGINGYIPVADGATDSWIPNSGTDHYLKLNEVPDNGDASYVYTSDAARELFVMGQRSGNTSSIDSVEALQINVLGRKENLGFKKMRTVIVSDPAGTDTPAGPVEELGDTQWFADTYTVQWETSDMDPRTSSNWDISDIIGGNVHFGFEMIN